jgi:hypothetical protein
MIKYKGILTLTHKCEFSGSSLPASDNTSSTSCDFVTLFQLQRLHSTKWDRKIGMIMNDWEEMVYLKVPSKYSLGESDRKKQQQLSPYKF